MVTLTSVVLDPGRLTTFGILHSITVCSILALPAAFGPAWLAGVLGGVLIGVGIGVEHEVFNSPWLTWTGLARHVEPTFDHQPLLPWLGVVLLGNVLGRWLLPDRGSPLARWHSEAPPVRLLAMAGRHSLLVYMAHVPALMIVMEALARLR